jgi:hypothetical protein
MYKHIKKLASGWDALFEDSASNHSRIISKKNNEIESIKKQYKYNLQLLEFERRSILENQKNEHFKREQEVLDSINGLTNAFKFSKKHWDENLTEIEVLIREQHETRDFRTKNKSKQINEINSEINKILAEISPSKIENTKAQPQEKIQSPFADFSNIISPISKNANFHFPFKMNEPGIPLSKRSKENAPDSSNDCYEDFIFSGRVKNSMIAQSGIEQDDSKLSRRNRPKDGWDPNLEDDQSEESESDKIEKALSLLYDNGLLDPVRRALLKIILLGLYWNV